MARLFSRLTLPREGNTPHPLTTLHLKPGQVVDAKVLKSIPPGMVELQVLGKQVRVATHIPLKKGNRLVLKYVPGKDGGAVLRLVHMTSSGEKQVNLPAIHGAIKGRVWDRIMGEPSSLTADALSAREDIRQLLKRVSDRMGALPGRQGLETLINASGLSWENKLFQLLSEKNISQEMIRTLMESDVKGILAKNSGSSEASNSDLKLLGTALENIQLLNLHGVQQGGKLFLPLPLEFSDGTVGLVQILLGLSPDARGESHGSEEVPGGGTSRPYSVVLLIELTTLGAIRAELTLSGTHVQGQFLVDRQTTRDRMEKELPAFMVLLESKGFSIGYMGCRQMESQVVKKPLVDEIFSREGSSVCFVA